MMAAFWTAYGSTMVVGGLLLAVVIGILVKLVRAKRTGKSVGCGCGCRDCPGASACYSHRPPKS